MNGCWRGALWKAGLVPTPHGAAALVLVLTNTWNGASPNGRWQSHPELPYERCWEEWCAAVTRGRNAIVVAKYTLDFPYLLQESAPPGTGNISALQGCWLWLKQVGKNPEVLVLGICSCVGPRDIVQPGGAFSSCMPVGLWL